MSKDIILEAENRGAEDNKTQIKKTGYLSGNLYGYQIKNKPIKVKIVKFENIFKLVGKSKIFTLKIDKEEYPVIIKEVQKDYVKNSYVHVDFYKVSDDRKITVDVRLKMVGEAGAVKRKGGILLVNKESVRVKCLPGDLKEEIEIDLSKLENYSDSIRLSDLNLSDKIEVMGQPGELIANVTQPKKGGEGQESDKKADGKK